MPQKIYKTFSSLKIFLSRRESIYVQFLYVVTLIDLNNKHDDKKIHSLCILYKLFSFFLLRIKTNKEKIHLWT